MAHQTIKLRIDGIEVEVEKGKSILEAAQAAGIRIPSLCHDRRLVPFGACRLCMVEEKGKPELIPSCFTPAKNGMEILTNTPKIIQSRRIQLQFILLNHPMTCPRCEKEGECDLQDLVYEYGVGDTPYPWEPIHFPEDRSPLIQRHGNKCILCGRCVRICDEVQGVGELSFTHRGIRAIIDTDFHRPLNCEFCGQCLDTCPVAAITSDCFDTQTKFWELKETTTPCPYCSVGCLLIIGSKDGEIKRVFSSPEKGPNDGNLCVRGRFGWDVADSPERIEDPLLKRNGAFEKASWEEALRFVVQRLEEVKSKYGPESIGAIVSPRLTNEEYFLFKRLFEEAIGTKQIALATSPGDLGLAEGLAKSLGIGASTNSIQEIGKADCLLVIGVDPAQTHPIVKNEIHRAIRKNRAQLIVLGPSDIGLSRASRLSPLSPPSLLIPARPGQELAFLNGMSALVLKEGLEDRGFIDRHTSGVEAMSKAQDHSPLSEEERALVEKAARAFARSKRSMILVGSGPWSRGEAEKIGLACANLALLTGHVGKEGSGILLLLEKCNSQGAIDMGVPGPKEVKDLLRAAEEGNLKALYLVGANPATNQKALQGLELLVVQDLFLTETGKQAHAFLPASSFVEKEGTYTSLERRVQALQPLRPPRGRSERDFDIFLQLLRMMESPLPGETPQAIFQEISARIPWYRDLTVGEQWPKGTTYLYGEGFPSGKANILPVGSAPPPPPIEDYPFFLIERPTLFRSGELSLRSGHLKKVMEPPALRLNAEEARSMNLEEGEVVELVSQAGKKLRLKVRLSADPIPGVILTPYPSPMKEEGPVRVRLERLKK
ncbi:MAG: molybdopterin-dependent oxidoreductase [Desulfobacterota bacterium]|nr:molybdopterin-dependent oxidoreductase [Thermodesulfobacteriota bacterium]